HAQNILIHQNNIKLADFGLSRKINDASNHSTDVFGVVPYIDPEYLKNIRNKNKSQLYLLNPKSDVYSVGVLLWQISSGHRPFYSKNEEYDASLVIEIIKGRREKIIEGTSTEYSELYKACWSDDSNERPTLQQVVDSLRAIISENDKFHSIIIHTKNKTESQNDKALLELQYGLYSHTDEIIAEILYQHV
ncbi:20271_t:CDS:2, partial [Funneliformis geosporum]